MIKPILLHDQQRRLFHDPNFRSFFAYLYVLRDQLVRSHFSQGRHIDVSPFSCDV